MQQHNLNFDYQSGEMTTASGHKVQTAVQKETAAEKNIKEKYELTMSQLETMKNQNRTGSGSASKSKRAGFQSRKQHTTFLPANENYSSTDGKLGQIGGSTRNQSKQLNATYNLTLDKQLQISKGGKKQRRRLNRGQTVEVRPQNLNFLSLQHQQPSTNSKQVHNVQQFNADEDESTGLKKGSLTRQIFVDDKNSVAQMVTVEEDKLDTESSKDQTTRNDSQLRKAIKSRKERKLRTLNTTYLEQEFLDKSSVQDLIGASSKAGGTTNQSRARDHLFDSNFTTEANMVETKTGQKEQTNEENLHDLSKPAISGQEKQKDLNPALKLISNMNIQEGKSSVHQAGRILAPSQKDPSIMSRLEIFKKDEIQENSYLQKQLERLSRLERLNDSVPISRAQQKRADHLEPTQKKLGSSPSAPRLREKEAIINEQMSSQNTTDLINKMTEQSEISLRFPRFGKQQTGVAASDKTSSIDCGREQNHQGQDLSKTLNQNHALNIQSSLNLDDDVSSSHRSVISGARTAIRLKAEQQKPQGYLKNYQQKNEERNKFINQMVSGGGSKKTQEFGQSSRKIRDKFVSKSQKEALQKAKNIKTPTGSTNKNLNKNSGDKKTQQVKMPTINEEEVIHQDSELIKHDFSVSQSKIASNYSMATRQQTYLQKLIGMLKGQEVEFPSDLNSMKPASSLITNQFRDAADFNHSSTNRKVQISSVYDDNDLDDLESNKKQGHANEKLKYNESISGMEQSETNRVGSPLQSRRIIKKSKNFEFQTPTKDKSSSPNRTTTTGEQGKQSQSHSKVIKGSRTNLAGKLQNDLDSTDEWVRRDLTQNFENDSRVQGQQDGQKDATVGQHFTKQRTLPFRKSGGQHMQRSLEVSGYTPRNQILETKREWMNQNSTEELMDQNDLSLDQNPNQLRKMRSRNSKTILQTSNDKSSWVRNRNFIQDLRIKEDRKVNRRQMYKSLDVEVQRKQQHESHNQFKIRKTGRRLINQEKLTSVPQKGKMIETQKYIRESLLPYVNKEKLGFYRKVKPDATKDTAAVSQELTTQRRTEILLGKDTLNRSPQNMLATPFLFTEDDQPGRNLSKLEIMTTENGDKIEVSPIKKPVKITRKRVKRSDIKVGDLQNSLLAQQKLTQKHNKPKQTVALSQDRSFNLTPWGNETVPQSARTSRMISERPLSKFQDNKKIVEQEDQVNFEGSNGPEEIEAQKEENLTVDELQGQNSDLREELGRVIQVFEQYLKVAQLKEVAKSIDHTTKKVTRSPPRLEISKLNSTANSFKFNKSLNNEQEKAPVKRQSQLRSSQLQKRPRQDEENRSQIERNRNAKRNSSTAIPSPQRAKKIRYEKSVQEQQHIDLPKTDRTFQMNIKENKSIISVEQRTVTKSVLFNRTYDTSFSVGKHGPPINFNGGLNHQIPKVFFSKFTGSGTQKDFLKGQLNSVKTKTLSNISEAHSRIYVKDQQQNQVVLDPLCSLTSTSFGNPYLSRKVHQAIKGPLAANMTIPGHITHNQILKMIEIIWIELEQRHNFSTKIVPLQNQLRQNEKLIAKNRLQLQEQDHNLHQIRSSMSQRTKKSKRIATMSLKDKKKVESVEQKLKIEKERAVELNTWGLQSDLFAIILKCRLLEDLIDAAQRAKVKSDKFAEKELYMLKLLQKKTENDIHGFLEARNKKRWRTWDNPRDLTFKKLNVVSKEVSDFELNLIFKHAKGQYTLLCAKNDQIIQDGDAYVHIARLMVDFVSGQFGNQGWLLMNKSKRLREIQFDEGQSQSEKTAAFSGADNQENRRSSLNWLQLTKGGLDLGIYTQNSEPVDPFENRLRNFGIKSGKDSRRNTQEPESPRRKDTILGIEEEKVSEVIGSKESPKQLLPFINVGSMDLEDSSSPDVTMFKGIREEENEESSPEKSKTTLNNETKTFTDKQRTLQQIQADQLDKTSSNSKHSSNSCKSLNPHLNFDQISDSSLNNVKSETSSKREAREEREHKGWLEVIKTEREQTKKRKRQESAARKARLDRLFAEANEFGEANGRGVDSDDDEMVSFSLDKRAALSGLSHMMDRVNVHLSVEMKLMQKWHEQDKELGLDPSKHRRQAAKEDFDEAPITGEELISKLKKEKTKEKVQTKKLRKAMRAFTVDNLGTATNKQRRPDMIEEQENAEVSSTIGQNDHTNTINEKDIFVK